MTRFSDQMNISLRMYLLRLKSWKIQFDDDTESIITNERYVYISSIIGECVTKEHGKE